MLRHLLLAVMLMVVHCGAQSVMQAVMQAMTGTSTSSTSTVQQSGLSQQQLNSLTSSQLRVKCDAASAVGVSLSTKTMNCAAVVSVPHANKIHCDVCGTMKPCPSVGQHATMYAASKAGEHTDRTEWIQSCEMETAGTGSFKQALYFAWRQADGTKRSILKLYQAASLIGGVNYSNLNIGQGATSEMQGANDNSATSLRWTHLSAERLFATKDSNGHPTAAKVKYQKVDLCKRVQPMECVEKKMIFECRMATCSVQSHASYGCPNVDGSYKGVHGDQLDWSSNTNCNAISKTYAGMMV